MTKFSQPSFSVGGFTEELGEKWDSVFAPRKEPGESQEEFEDRQIVWIEDKAREIIGANYTTIAWPPFGEELTWNLDCYPSPPGSGYFVDGATPSEVIEALRKAVGQ